MCFNGFMDKHNRQARKATRLVVRLDELYPDKTTGELVETIRLMAPVPGSTAGEDLWWSTLVQGTDEDPPSLETIAIMEKILLARF